MKSAPKSKPGPPLVMDRLPEVARLRRPWLVVVGVLATVLAAVVVMTVLDAVAARTLVWSTQMDVVRGQPVVADHLVAVEVSADTAERLYPATVESRQELVGQVWVADVPAGQLVTRPLTAARLQIGDGRALVGLRLGPGEFPVDGLRPGDTVLVIRTAGQQGSGAEILTDDATVEAVVELGDQGVAADRMVTLSVPADSAVPIASAGSSSRARLAVVDR